MNLNRLLLSNLLSQGTTGCDGFQYNIVDAVVVPPDVLSYSFSEKLVYLPGTYQANDMPNFVLNTKATLKSEAPPNYEIIDNEILTSLLDRKDAIIICAFNSNKKMEPISFGGTVSFPTQHAF